MEGTRIDVDDMEQRLRRPEYAQVAFSLREIGFSSAADLFSTYAGQGRDLAAWLRDAAINRDRNLRLQYLAGMGLNLYQSQAIYTDLLGYRRFPDNLFVGSDAQKATLWEAIQSPKDR